MGDQDVGRFISGSWRRGERTTVAPGSKCIQSAFRGKPVEPIPDGNLQQHEIPRRRPRWKTVLRAGVGKHVSL